MSKDIWHIGTAEVRYDSVGDGLHPVAARWSRVDEIVATDIKSLHLEAMGESQWWIGLTIADGTELMVNLGAKNGHAKGYCFVEEGK